MSNTEITPQEVGRLAREIVDRLGPHCASGLGLDLDAGDDGALWRWLLVSALMGARMDEQRLLPLAPVLFEAPGRATPGGFARASASELGAILSAHRCPKPEAAAALLLRINRALLDGAGGSVERLCAEADDLETLGGRLAGLASGFGRAGVLRFLRPLRDRLSAAHEIPLAPAARAAALHLALLLPGEDEEGSPSALRRRVERDAEAPRWLDVEAALERLGSRACLRERVARCALPDACPLRTGSEAE